MNPELARYVAQILEMTHIEEDPTVLVPLDRRGNECGPPVVRYAPPAGPGLN